MTYDKFRVLFLGPTGGGKSSAVKTLLKVTDTPSATENADSSTSTHQTYRVAIQGKDMLLVDAPGLRNPDGNGEEIETDLRGAFHDISPGPHVIVIAFSVNTSADIIRKTCLRYQERLGQDVLKHATMVFTGVDTLEASGTNFQGFIDSLPKHIKQLIGSQLVALNNNANAPLINVLQVKELMTKFDQVVTKNFGLPFHAKRFADIARVDDIATDVRNVFEKNSAALESKMSADPSPPQKQDMSNVGVTVATIERPPGEHIHKGTTEDTNTSNLTHQNGQQSNTIDTPHEDVQLQSLPRANSETISRVSEDASMITSSSQDNDTQFCGCFSNITRKFRSSENEPGFSQFN